MSDPNKSYDCNDDIIFHLSKDMDTLRTENQRLRDALLKIEDLPCISHSFYQAFKIATQALKSTTPTLNTSNKPVEEKEV